MTGSVYAVDLKIWRRILFLFVIPLFDTYNFTKPLVDLTFTPNIQQGLTWSYITSILH